AIWPFLSFSTPKQNASPWRAFPNSLFAGSLDRGAMHCRNPRSNVVVGSRQTRSLSVEDGAGASVAKLSPPQPTPHRLPAHAQGTTNRRLALAGIEQSHYLLVAF